MTMSQSTEKAPSTKRPKRKQKCLPFHSYQRGEFFISVGYKGIPKFLQSQRKCRGNYFRCAYAYKDVCSDGWDKIFEKRFIVVSGGEKILQQHVFPDVEGSHGITWVGVHGINSDRKCVVDWLRNSPLSSYFTGYVLSEMEDVADSPPYLEKILKEPTVDSSPYSQKTLKPFAVVSLPDSSIADKKSCPEFSAPSLKGQREAIAHLKNELIGHSAFSMLQTQQIAICAFQRLWERDLKGDEITVCCLYEENCGCDYEVGDLSVAKVNRCLETMKQSGKKEI